MVQILPCDGLKVCDFAPQSNSASRFARSNQIQRTQLGPGYWVARIETRRLNQKEARIWSSFLTEVAGDMSPFLAWRLFRRKPLQPLQVDDANVAVLPHPETNELLILGCGAYSPRRGDMISYRTRDNGFFLCEATEDADCTADESNVRFKVWPRPVPAHETSPELKRVQALGLFHLTNPPDPFEDYTNRSIRLEARQILG